jgi:hypothetical protein
MKGRSKEHAHTIQFILWGVREIKEQSFHRKEQNELYEPEMKTCSWD